MTVILMYHRVAAVDVDPWGLCVSPFNFERQIQALHDSAAIVPLSAVSDIPSPSPRQVVITFDDGYADNLHAAAPVLERFAAPATVFIATDILEQRAEFWWDALERVLLRPGRVPETLRLSLGDAETVWDLGAAAVLTEQDWREARRWCAWQPAPTPRHAFYLDVWNRLRLSRDADQRAAIATIETWASLPAETRESHRTLSREELRRLAEGGMVEIGAHSRTHPMLPRLTDHEQRQEIVGSKEVLAGTLGRAVTAFSYPFGAYDAVTQSLVRDGGFTAACTTTGGTVDAASDRLALPRIAVADWTAETLLEHLAQWWTP